MDQPPSRWIRGAEALRRSWTAARRAFRAVAPARHVVLVGWQLQPTKASIIWPSPRPFLRRSPKPASAKSVQVCPAALDFDGRHVVVDCPVDLRLAMRMDEPGGPRLAAVDGAMSAVRPKHMGQMVHLVARSEWRRPDRPILQVVTPYLFVADEPVFVNQLPPFLDYVDPPLPGVLIGGRFPIDVWPRPLVWAFEWHDTAKELVLHRGQPWFYVRFEAEHPTWPVRLVECEFDQAGQAYVNSLTGVSNYVSRTFSLFETARERRPPQLLWPKRRAGSTLSR